MFAGSPCIVPLAAPAVTESVRAVRSDIEPTGLLAQAPASPWHVCQAVQHRLCRLSLFSQQDMGHLYKSPETGSGPCLPLKQPEGAAVYEQTFLGTVFNGVYLQGTR